METTEKKIPIRELAENYNDNGVNGVYAYKGRLDVRPPFQREFIYNDVKRDKVILTVREGYPFGGRMWWSKKIDGTYEIIDGQQRTISMCQYVHNLFAHNKRRFKDLTAEEQEQILNYKVDVVICDGTEKEKLDWFDRINISGEPLTRQELLNATYNGTFISDAKRYFSKRDCEAANLMNGKGMQLLSGNPIRQDWLETVLKWVADREGVPVEDYLSFNRQNYAAELWSYFESVFYWVKGTFKCYRREMKGIQWGLLYNKYGTEMRDPDKMESDIRRLMMDDDVTNKKGIYTYLLSGDEKYLNIRQFTPQMKREAYERQQGICPHCVNEHRDVVRYNIKDMEADHITPWNRGGKTNSDNCVMLCMKHNRIKGGR